MTTTEKRTYTVPTKAAVSPNNQIIFDNLQKGLGFMPILPKMIQHWATTSLYKIVKAH